MTSHCALSLPLDLVPGLKQGVDPSHCVHLPPASVQCGGREATVGKQLCQICCLFRIELCCHRLVVHIEPVGGVEPVVDVPIKPIGGSYPRPGCRRPFQGERVEGAVHKNY